MSLENKASPLPHGVLRTGSQADGIKRFVSTNRAECDQRPEEAPGVWERLGCRLLLG